MYGQLQRRTAAGLAVLDRYIWYSGGLHNNMQVPNSSQSTCEKQDALHRTNSHALNDVKNGEKHFWFDTMRELLHFK
jgi:hypothetical protein